MKTSNWLEQKIGIPYPIWSRSSVSALKREVPQADMVHIHDSLYFGNIIAARTAKSCGTPLMVTQHTGLVLFANPLLRGVLRVANQRVALKTLRAAAAVSFVSETSRSYFGKIGLQPGIGEVIPNGVDTGYVSSWMAITVPNRSAFLTTDHWVYSSGGLLTKRACPSFDT